MRAFYVPTAQLAVLLRLSTRRIQQLVTVGILPTPGRAGHDVVVAVPKYLAYVERPGESRTLSEARKKKVEVETQIKTLELRRRAGALVERHAVDNMAFRCSRVARDGMLNIPDRVSGLCAAETDQATIHAMLTKEILQCLEGLSDDTHFVDPRPDPPRPRRAPRGTARHAARPRGPDPLFPHPDS